jgi:transposase-like protein
LAGAFAGSDPSSGLLRRPLGKICDEDTTHNEAVHIALGARECGSKKILVHWLELSESAKFWLHVLNTMCSRGVENNS